MKRKRQINLDFTSLLDVIMIILFFFIIFGRIESGKLFEEIEAEKAALAADQAEAAALLDGAREQLAQSDRLLAEARLVMDEANAAEERSGENADGITEFARNRNVKFCLTMTDGGKSWVLNVQKDGNSVLVEKADSAAVADGLKRVFSESGYTPDDTILVEMIYDGDQVGTNAAYQAVDQAISEVAREYRHCFCSKIDLSDFSE